MCWVVQTTHNYNSIRIQSGLRVKEHHLYCVVKLIRLFLVVKLPFFLWLEVIKDITICIHILLAYSCCLLFFFYRHFGGKKIWIVLPFIALFRLCWIFNQQRMRNKHTYKKKLSFCFPFLFTFYNKGACYWHATAFRVNVTFLSNCFRWSRETSFGGILFDECHHRNALELFITDIKTTYTKSELSSREWNACYGTLFSNWVEFQIENGFNWYFDDIPLEIYDMASIAQ